MSTGEPSKPTSPTTLRAKRCLFSRLVAELIGWCYEQGWEIALDEGRIKTPRRGRIGSTVQLVEDNEHLNTARAKSLHYSGLAVDLLLYDDLDGDGEDDDYVTDGDDPRWKRIAERWESMHPLCTSGRRWHDGNHLSLGETDKSEPLP